MKNRIKAGRKSERGQAVVEFALVLPLLLVLLLGILDFGWIFVNQYQAEKAAASAARYGSLNVNRYRDSSSRTAYLDGVRERAAENLPESADSGSAAVSVSVGSESVSVTVSFSVRTISFMGGMIYGPTYTAASTCVSSY